MVGPNLVHACMLSHFSCSPPGFSVQARILEWAALPFSRGYKPNRSRRYQEEVARIHRTIPKKHHDDPDNHNGVITHLEPDILKCDGGRRETLVSLAFCRGP